MEVSLLLLLFVKIRIISPTSRDCSSKYRHQNDAMICTHIDYHNQHESPALIGVFHATSSVLTSVESYRNYRKTMQRGIQGYLSSLQRRVPPPNIKIIGPSLNQSDLSCTYNLLLLNRLFTINVQTS